MSSSVKTSQQGELTDAEKRLAIIAELKQNGFVQGDTQTGCRCDTCDKPIPGKRGWWRKTSYEYDEWDGYCIGCAHDWLHQYDEMTKEDMARMIGGESCKQIN